MRAVTKAFSCPLFVTLLLLLPSCATTPVIRSSTPELSVISQQLWGGIPYDGEGRTHTITRITLHHSGETYGGDAPTPHYLWKFQQWCRQEKSWIDIPYHFLIDLEGRVFEGRDIRYAGDTNTDYDPAGHALICVLGNYEEQEPNESQLDAVVRLMTFLTRSYGLSPETIRGHRDVADSTVCPGSNLYRHVSSGYFTDQVRRNLSTP
jgi:hypothetical protein